MEILETKIDGLVLIKPKVFSDDRGYFYESYNKVNFSNLIGREIAFVQDNQSKSQKNVLRGLHFQKPPYAQGKLVRVITGSVLDIAVDIRKKSPTYGQHYSVLLDDKNYHMLWIPEGFAHGFVSLEDNTIFSYKCTNYYNKESESCILWNDKHLNIDWEIDQPILSEKDKIGEKFSSFASQF